ncbi:type II secretion system protein N [Thauera phenolivorans]|uniref:type II secretion system protein N n=1 Tax=Thauera phenolivorans TaxID=1792543 RepID=UPI00083A449E|nr:type II secretion system protein N [Thauera phenolivorans]
MSAVRRALARIAGALSFLVLLAALLLARLPAGLVDAALARLTDGGLRLAEARGTLWRGSALLAGREVDGGELAALLPLAWTFSPSGLLRGELAWSVDAASRAAGSIRVAADGVALEALSLTLPLRTLAAASKHPLAHAGWGGSLQAESEELHCDWTARCSGALALEWRDAASALLPQARLGRYRVRTAFREGDLEFGVRTPEGLLRITGEGSLPFGGRLAFEGSVAGEPGLVGRLPAVLDGIAFAGEDPAKVTLRIR